MGRTTLCNILTELCFVDHLDLPLKTHTNSNGYKNGYKNGYSNGYNSGYNNEQKKRFPVNIDPVCLRMNLKSLNSGSKLNGFSSMIHSNTQGVNTGESQCTRSAMNIMPPTLQQTQVLRPQI